jgi:hypothetical protein
MDASRLLESVLQECKILKKDIYVFFQVLG